MGPAVQRSAGASGDGRRRRSAAGGRAAAGRSAGGRAGRLGRPVRRHVAPRLQGDQGLPRLRPSQLRADAALAARSQGPGPARPGQGVDVVRGRHRADPAPAPRPQVVRWGAVHGRRHHLLVGGDRDQHRHHRRPARGVGDQRRADGAHEDRRRHHHAHVRRPQRTGGDGRAGLPRQPVAAGLRALRLLRAAPLPGGVPSRVQLERERLPAVRGQGVRLQHRAAGHDPLAGHRVGRRRHRAGRRAQPLLLEGGHRGQPAPVHRPPALHAGGGQRGGQPAGHRRRDRHADPAHAAQQVSGLPAERRGGRVPHAAVEQRRRIACDVLSESELRRSQVPRADAGVEVPAGAVAGHRPRPDQRGRAPGPGHAAHGVGGQRLGAVPA